MEMLMFVTQSQQSNWGVEDVEVIQNSKLHNKNINQNITKDEVEKLQSWYRKFHENIAESIYI